MLTPERRAFLRRWREELWALALLMAGIWIFTRGGWLLQALGVIILCLGLGLGWTALRRHRFRRVAEKASGPGPGVVELLEGQIGYMGPEGGGFLSLPELSEVRLIDLSGQLHWRLRQGDGQSLLVPVGAAGADQLFDVFAALPGMDMRALLAAFAMAAAGATEGGGAMSGPQDLQAVPLWRGDAQKLRTQALPHRP